MLNKCFCVAKNRQFIADEMGIVWDADAVELHIVNKATQNAPKCAILEVAKIYGDVHSPLP